MSTNLIYNSKFDIPLITTNDFKYYINLTAEEKTNFYWAVLADNSTITIQNGVTAYNYASPSLINLTQAISFQVNSSIAQTVTILDLVTYQLRFNYVCRPSYLINPLNVYFNDVLTYTVSTHTTSWSEIIIDYTPLDFGNLTIKFETVQIDGEDRNICFTNINFFQKQTTGGGGAPGTTSKIVTYNSLKNTNIYGALTINDLNINGSKISGRLLLNNIDTSIQLNTNLLNTNRIVYNYTTIPGNNNNQLGHIQTFNYTGPSSIGANAFANILVNLNPGVYLIDAYALFSIAQIPVTTRLGMNTVINTLSTDYNYTSFRVDNSTGQHSITYNYFLRNTTLRSYYIYYNCAFATTMAKFQVNILRIA